jgi:hypothetical protein
VVAGCNDPQKLWRGTILLAYEFADYPKYEEEVRKHPLAASILPAIIVVYKVV